MEEIVLVCPPIKSIASGRALDFKFSKMEITLSTEFGKIQIYRENSNEMLYE